MLFTFQFGQYEIKEDNITQSVSVTVQSKLWVFRPSFVWIAGSDPAWGMDICVLLMPRNFSYKSVRRADPSAWEALPSRVCLIVILEHQKWAGLSLSKAPVPR